MKLPIKLKLIGLVGVACMAFNTAQAQSTCPSVPKINSFSPVTANIGSTVTINGANFDPTPANNAVYFGSTKAEVLSASFGQLKVKVPVGAAASRISVTNNCDLTAYSLVTFNGIFCSTPMDNNTYRNTTVDIAVSYGSYNMLSVDLDNDGKPELVSVGTGGVSIGKNNSTSGSLSFSALNFAGGGSSVSKADFDGDGKMDLFTASRILRNTSTGAGNIGFSSTNSLRSGYQGNVGDFNNDGKIDLVVETSSTLYFMRNTSSGPGNISFQNAGSVSVGNRATGIQCADVDGDGKIDVLLTQGGLDRAVSVRNTTSTDANTFTFETPEHWSSIGDFPYRCMIGDFDADGKIDLASVNYGQGANDKNTVVWRNTSTSGNISFATATTYSGPDRNYRLGVGDVNGDGLPDIVTKPLSDGDFAVYVNQSTGAGSISFSSAYYYPTAAVGVSGVAIGDLDGDYVPDISTSSTGSNRILVHRNTSAQVDTENPTAKCKNYEAALSPSGSVTVTADLVDNGSSDACGLNRLEISKDGGVTRSSSVSFTCADTGIVAVTLYAIDNAGNIDSCSANVNVAPAAIITPGQSTVCKGETVSLTANDGDTYQWYKDGVLITGATSKNYTASETGDYTVEVTNSGGCSGTSNALSVAVNNNPTISISPSDSVKLCTGSVTFTAGSAAIYQWYRNGTKLNNEQSQTLVATDTGSYFIQVIDLFGCTATSDTVYVAPLAICNSDTIFGRVSNSRNFSITTDDVNNGPTDGCGGSLNLSLSKSTFTKNDVGANNVTLTVTDQSSYSNTCNSVVFIEYCPETFSTITEVATNYYTSPSGKILDLSGTYLDTIPNHELCDSIITINLRVIYNPIYVDSAKAKSGLGRNWGAAFKTLQEALDYVMENEVDTVYLATGTYAPTKAPCGSTDPKDLAFHLVDSSLVLLGGYNPVTHTVVGYSNLTGIMSSDTAKHVFITSGLDSNTSFQNLIIQEGAATSVDTFTCGLQPFYGYFGGGMYNIQSSPKLENVIFENNEAVNGGAIFNNQGAPIINNVTIRYNTASRSGGGMYNIAGASPMLTNVTIDSNYAAINGGGMANVSSAEPHLVNVTIKRNRAGYRGGGIYNASSSDMTMINGAVDNNRAGWYGGGVYNYDYSIPVFTNIVISNNTAQTGGGVYNYFQSNAVFNNTSILNNSGTKSAGGIYAYGSFTTINNSWFMDNTNKDVVRSGGMLMGTNNASDEGTNSPANVGSGFVSLANMSATDLIADINDLDGPDDEWRTEDDGFRSVICSPLVDAGSTSSVPSGTEGDITNQDRVQGSQVDIGAYEAIFSSGITLPTQPGTYTSDKAYTQGDYTYFINCADGHLIMALDLDQTGAVVPDTGVSLFIGQNKTVSWLTDGGLITNTKGGAMIDRRWDVSPTTQPTSAVTVQYFFTDEEYEALVDTLANHNGGASGYATTINKPEDMNMYKLTNTTKFLSPHASTAQGIVLAHGSTPSTTKWVYEAYNDFHSATYQVSSFSGGGGGSGGGSAPLPVELIEFTVNAAENHSALLNWATATEINNSHFIIERSYDGSSFEPISRVEGNGTTNEVMTYEYLDGTIAKNQNTVYYRLHQFDYDGASEYSELRAVDFSKEVTGDIVNVYPNPFRNEVYVNIASNEREELTISLVSMQGEVLSSQEAEAGSTTKLDLNELAGGIYFIQVTGARTQYTQRVIKQ